MALTLGTGTVVSVAPDYLEWTRANAPKDKHYRALFPNALLQPLTEEAARRGQVIGWRSPNLSFLPAREPVAAPVPEGLRAMPFGSKERAQWFPSGEFHNALGELDDPADQDFRYGLAIMDGEHPAAVAGAWDDSDGLKEIGVDVARDYRGRGLGVAVVTNLARLIADHGDIPTYYCSPTNVRSHRNALACGFTPVASSAKAGLPQPA
jgi:RimJ/RimL family protein N-acetyltransferase